MREARILIKVSNIVLPLGFDEKDMKIKAAMALDIPPDKILDFNLSRLSVDARKKNNVHYVCAVTLSAEDEEKLVSKAKSRNVELFIPKDYKFPQVNRKSKIRPVVVGMGPAGLFAALHLARAGIPPIILERGRNVAERTEDVERFWRTGSLSLNSNVQFGEGGAGTFSDGKLSTGINDPRISHVFETFVEHGAPEDILWSHKPHIGTDILRDVVKSIRQELISLGCDIRFGHKLSGLQIEENALAGIHIMSDAGAYDIACDTLVLAPGHSARDTFTMLFDTGVPMEQKAFAIGVRIEHRQNAISISQYGEFAEKLPPADYKLSCHLPNRRSAFSFCVCPGGQVIAAASETERLVTNGMSPRARNGENINGGFLVGITPSDFSGNHPLSGMKFQEFWEKHAYNVGGGDYRAPIQTVGDFLSNKETKKIGSVLPTYRPDVQPADLRKCLPDYVSETLCGALPIFDRSLHGFADPEAIMTGIETRSSSPVRILRGENCQSSVRGIFPCGEGAGYAGGITSAAVDGIRISEAIASLP
jgi:uncharacterized FAD-dependent dehydrogenase